MDTVSHELLKDRTTGTKVYSDFEAVLEAVRWWCHTPKGSKIGMPDYGHDFEKYQNESMSIGIMQDIEAETVIGIERDINVKIGAVYAKPTQEDAICDIIIAVSDGTEAGIVADRITA